VLLLKITLLNFNAINAVLDTLASSPRAKKDVNATTFAQSRSDSNQLPSADAGAGDELNSPQPRKKNLKIYPPACAAM
jgi:hypothetical protein